MQATYSLRPITAADEGFLYEVYASTRAEELAVTGWSEAEKQHFLRFQFNAQHSYYQEHYGDAAFDVIQSEGQPVGRLYLQKLKDEHRIVDIALLPQHRGKGLGGRILQDLLDQATKAQLPLRIHVEQNNRAMGLYQRLGFQKVSEHGIYHLMEKLFHRDPA